MGFQKRLINVRAAERYEREAAVAKAVTDAAGLMKQEMQPMKVFQMVERFTDKFRSWKLRRPMVVIVGATNLGKSLLAADIMKRIGAIVGWIWPLLSVVSADIYGNRFRGYRVVENSCGDE